MIKTGKTKIVYYEVRSFGKRPCIWSENRSAIDAKVTRKLMSEIDDMISMNRHRDVTLVTALYRATSAWQRPNGAAMDNLFGDGLR